MNMHKTKIILVDDHRVVLEGIKSALKEYPEFYIAGEVTDGTEAVNLAATLKPDIMILDISMPGMNGIEIVKKLKLSSPGIKIVIYTMHSDKEFIIDLFKIGVSAYVLKDDPLSDLALSLKAVAGGGTYFSSMAPNVLARRIKELEEKDAEDNLYRSLSLREREVFKCLAEGENIKEIADILCISPKTVESHKYNIMEKLQAKSVVDLTKLAIKNKLIKV